MGDLGILLLASVLLLIGSGVVGVAFTPPDAISVVALPDDRRWVIATGALIILLGLGLLAVSLPQAAGELLPTLTPVGAPVVLTDTPRLLSATPLPTQPPTEKPSQTPSPRPTIPLVPTVTPRPTSTPTVFRVPTGDAPQQSAMLPTKPAF